MPGILQPPDGRICLLLEKVCHRHEPVELLLKKTARIAGI